MPVSLALSLAPRPFYDTPANLGLRPHSLRGKHPIGLCLQCAPRRTHVVSWLALEALLHLFALILLFLYFRTCKAISYILYNR